jgi:hypothetical protein
MCCATSIARLWLSLKKINGPIRDLQKVALVLPNSPRMTNVTGKPALEHLVCQREDSE